MTIQSASHWLQNWPKTHAYVAEKMFYPTSVGQVAECIQTAEADHRPVRAVGGGWSFSDAALPGSVSTNRPNVYAVEALSAVVPITQSFPDKSLPSIATIVGAPLIFDGPGSMVMINEGVQPSEVDARWSYQGMGNWKYIDGTLYGAATNFLDWLGSGNWRPVRDPMSFGTEESDTAGSLVMFDQANNAAAGPLRDWFYNGHGVWSVGVMDDTTVPDQGNWQVLSHDHKLTPPGMNLSPRAAHASDTLFRLLSKQKTVTSPGDSVYVVNTRSMTSSLQQQLPSLLCQSALDATSDAPPNGASRRFLFHVEAGISIAELGPLLAHQSPRLTLQAISGSPGATLAGALSTATHGAEFNWPLLIDRVRAVHFVGPGGLQWWIEGSESIVDPQKLRAAYSDMAPERIISGTKPVMGILPRDWLSAAVVSMGCMGVVYSLVLEVVPLFGVHEVVVQRTWKTIGNLGKFDAMNLPLLLIDPATSKEVSRRLVKLMQNGNFNGTMIPQADANGVPINQYADLAINPNPRRDGDLDCWVGNRELTPFLPIDPQSSPGSSNEIAGVLKGLVLAFGKDDLVQKFKNINGFGSALDIVGNLVSYSGARGKVNRLAQATDLIDVGLDTLLGPLVGPVDGPELAHAILTGILSGLLNTANPAGRSDKIGVSVGALGFPESGIMGTGLEIALSPDDAFGFLQMEILDKVSGYNANHKPFMGYVSIRLCSKTETLMGMQQFGTAANPCSVMIEVVGYGDAQSRSFVADLQQRTVDLIHSGLDAMLHWGLENDLLRAHHLRSIKALQAASASGISKLGTFKAVRSRLHGAAPASFRVFDNNFTDRLGLSALNGITFCDDIGKVIHVWTPTALLAQPGFPLTATTSTFLHNLGLLNELDRPVQVTGVRIVCRGDAPGSPVIKVLSPLPITVPAGQRVGVEVQCAGALEGKLTGMVTVDCDDPVDPTAQIPVSATVTGNRHAELQITPSSLNLTGLVGSVVENTITLANTGLDSAVFANQDGSIINMNVTPAGPFTIEPIFPMSSLPGNLAGGASVAIRVLYQPTAIGPTQATFSIEMKSRSDAGVVNYEHRYEIPITATAHMPGIFLAAGPQEWMHISGQPDIPIGTRELLGLDFGVVGPAENATASFWIRSVGDVPVTVQGVAVPNQSIFGVQGAFPAVLPPAAEMEVSCQFVAPRMPGSQVRGELRILSDDPRQPPTGMPLTVQGKTAGPHLIEPNEMLNLGIVPPSPAFGILTFRSDGSSPVTLRQITLREGTDFSVSGAPAMPAELAPGTDLILTITMIATQPGLHQDQLFVAHDGKGGRSSQVVLKGSTA